MAKGLMWDYRFTEKKLDTNCAELSKKCDCYTFP